MEKQKGDLTVANLEIRKDRAEGSILGAFFADSIGSALEFKETADQTEADFAMTMPGMTGPWRLAPGQVTDDSELAMA